MKQLLPIYNIAAEAIKIAILQGQYEAAKGINRIQLATYFRIGKYVSQNTRQGVWGTGALNCISSRLKHILPGLRGYSPDSLKLMRTFYEEWSELDADSLNKGYKEQEHSNIEIRELQFTNSSDFPMEDFLKVPFTHHSRILSKVKVREERLYE